MGIPLFRGILPLGLWLLSLLAGCRSVEHWEPDVSLGRFDTLSVEPFAAAEPGLGESLAEQLAREFARRGLFAGGAGAATASTLEISGTVRHYDPGNVALRMKMGRGLGQGRLVVSVSLRDSASGGSLARFEIEETTLQTGPDARRTGREKGKWLQRQFVASVADRVEARLAAHAN